MQVKLLLCIFKCCMGVFCEVKITGWSSTTEKVGPSGRQTGKQLIVKARLLLSLVFAFTLFFVVYGV